jgi:hypothetical protein
MSCIVYFLDGLLPQKFMRGLFSMGSVYIEPQSKQKDILKKIMPDVAVPRVNPHCPSF